MEPAIREARMAGAARRLELVRAVFAERLRCAIDDLKKYHHPEKYPRLEVNREILNSIRASNMVLTYSCNDFERELNLWDAHDAEHRLYESGKNAG
jgi:hypothetical protein